MTRRWAATVVVAALVACLVSLCSWARPAEAAQGCATRAEWHRVHQGQTVRKVRHLVGARGRLAVTTWGPGYAAARTGVLTFRVCGSTYGEAHAYLAAPTTAAPLRVTRKDFTR